MVVILHPPLEPKNGFELWILATARISTLQQDELSLGDQEALIRRWIDEHYQGRYKLVMISGGGRGERLDRKELRRLYEELETRRYDLVIAEDLGRIMRR